MDRFQVSDPLFDDETPDPLPVQGRQRIDFLEFIQILFYGFDGQVARRDAVGIGDEELVVKLVHLPLEALGAVHHFEHVIQLFAGKDGTIGRLPDSGSQATDQGAVCGGCFYDGEHDFMNFSFEAKIRRMPPFSKKGRGLGRENLLK